MKRTFSILILVVMLAVMLTGCGLNVARPEVKEGRFHITVTYEHNGVVKEASAVYVCEYDGIVWYNVNRDPFVNWKESFEGDIKDGGVLPICNTDDGGKIFIGLLLYPEYFMGDPNYAEHTPIVRAELFYDDKQISDADVIAEYGVRLIGYECDAPLENSFRVFDFN